MGSSVRTTVFLSTKAMQKHKHQKLRRRSQLLSDTEVKGQYLCLITLIEWGCVESHAGEKKTLKPGKQVDHFSLILVTLTIKFHIKNV